jgi:hypothetical protein
VTFLEGRRVRHVQEKRRWIDDYRCVCLCGRGCWGATSRLLMCWWHGCGCGDGHLQQ